MKDRRHADRHDRSQKKTGIAPDEMKPQPLPPLLHGQGLGDERAGWRMVGRAKDSHGDEAGDHLRERLREAQRHAGQRYTH